MRTRVNELPGGVIEFHRSVRSIAGAAFLLFWWIGWSAGTGFLVMQVYNDPSIFMALFALPFVAAWVAVAVMLLWMLFGVERLVLGYDMLTCESRAIVRWHRRDVPLADVKRVRLYRKVVDSESGRREVGLELLTTGKPIRFGQGLEKDELRYLAHMLRTLLGLETQQREKKRQARQPTSTRVLPTAEEPTQPTDSVIRLAHDFRSLRVTIPGQWSAAAIGATLFINLFWNGVVSVFVYQLFFGDMPWGMRVFLAVFLIPFEVIGAAMLLALVAALLGPLLRETWQFERDVARWRITAIFLRWSRRWPMHDVTQLHISKDDGKGLSARMTTNDEDGKVRLKFVDADNRERFAMTDLSRGEAKWLAYELMQQFPGQFDEHGHTDPQQPTPPALI